MKFAAGWFWYVNWYAGHKGRTPILVYQMGKVGSTTLTQTLKKYKLHPVLQVHRLHPSNINKAIEDYRQKGQKPPEDSLGTWVYNNICLKKKKVKIITIVREPISRNISAFFENFKRFTGINYGEAYLPTKKIMELFLSEYNHDVPLTWFDIEMAKTVGIDIYSYAFPKEKGHLTIKQGNIKLLVFKLEMPEVIKQKAIAEFLNIQSVELARKNVGENKNYSQQYLDFTKRIQLPFEYLEKMLNSKFARHFYSAAEIETTWQRWNHNYKKSFFNV